MVSKLKIQNLLEKFEDTKRKS